MIAEIGHFAVLLAFAIAILQSVIPLIGAQKNWAGWMQLGDSAAVSQFVFAIGCQQFAFCETYVVQGHWRLGQSRRLYATLDSDFGLLWRAGRVLWAEPACSVKGACSGGSIYDFDGFLGLLNFHLEPIHPIGKPAFGWK